MGGLNISSSLEINPHDFGPALRGLLTVCLRQLMHSYSRNNYQAVVVLTEGDKGDLSPRPAE